MKTLKKRIGTVIILLLAVLLNSVFAQNDGDDVSIGKYHKIHSKILNEDRTLLIHLPRSYHSINASYPVLYMLYGNHTTTYYAEAVSVLDRLGSTARIPEMILVGITNTDRYRDLLPQKPDGSPTGIDHFIQFFKEELLPYIDKNYRTKNYRVIMGPQAGANFCFYALFKQPEIFDAYIINNPFRWTGGRDIMFQQAQSFLKKNKSLKKFLYITYNDGDELDLAGIPYVKKFQEMVNLVNPDHFRLGLNFIQNNDEFIAPMGLRKGIKTLFQNYPFPENVNVENLNDLLTYYKELSNELGFEVDVPDQVLTQQSDKLSEAQKTAAAIEIWYFMLEKNPNSGNALWRLANYHQNTGNLVQAKEYYGRMLAAIGSDAGMIQNRYDQVDKMIRESAAYALEQEIRDSGLDAAKSKYVKIQSSKEKYFDEREFNTLGYRYLQQSKMEETIFVFSVNVDKFPDSANAYDSLAEACMIKGDKNKAIEYYKKSLELNPDNTNAREKISILKEK